MEDIIQALLDVTVTVAQAHRFLLLKISLLNMIPLVLDIVLQSASQAVLVLVVVFPCRLTKAPSLTQDPTCKLAAAVQHTPVVEVQAGHLLGLHQPSAAVMSQ